MIDTSFLLGPTPTPLLNPLDVQAKKMAIRNALAAGALQDQAIQTGALDLQERQQAATGLAALYRDQYRAPSNVLAPPAVTGPALASAPPPPSVVPDSTGTGVMPSAPAPSPALAAAPPAPAAPAAPVTRPPVPTMADLVGKYKLPYAAAQKVLEGMQKVEENAAVIGQKHADTAKAQAELQGLVQEQGALSAQSIIDSNYNPAVIQHQLQHFASLGPEYRSLAAGVDQKIQANPADMPALFQAMAASGKGNREARAAETTADAHMLTSRATASKDVAELPGIQADSERKQLVNAASKLGAATNRDDYAKALTALAQTSPQLAAQFPPAASWTAGTRGQVLKIGMTAPEQVSADETAARDRQTAAYQAGELGVSRARLGVEQSNAQVNRAAADPWGALGINQHPMGAGNANLTGQAFLDTLPPQMAATVRAVAEGRQTNLPRGGKELDQLMGAVNQFDPTYSVQRAQTRTAFQTGKQGQNIGNLNTAVVHLDQYHEVMKAMHNGSFQPGNRLYNYLAAKLGSANVTNPDFVRQSLAGEAANALKGNATDPEIAHILSSLDPTQSPAQQEGTALEGLRLLGTKLNTYDEQYHQVNADDPWSPVLPTARAVFSRYKIQPLTRTGTAPEGATAATAPAARSASTSSPAAAPVSVQHMSTDDLLKALVKK